MVMNSTRLLNEYFKAQEDAETKYGPRSVVLFRKGNFYNIFE